MKKLPKPKIINYIVIDKNKDPEPYELLGEAMTHHHELYEAKIALAWRRNWKENKDGQVILGKCMKVPDLQREIMPYYFVIVLNFEVFHNPRWTDAMKLAVIDHELCHAAISKDDKGNIKYNERGREVYRVRKHDVEEFHCIVKRHGTFKHDLQAFANNIMNSDQPTLFSEKADKTEKAEAK